MENNIVEESTNVINLYKDIFGSQKCIVCKQEFTVFVWLKYKNKNGKFSAPICSYQCFDKFKENLKKIEKNKKFCYFYEINSLNKRLFWFRIFGRGLAIEKRDLSFSERYKYSKYLKLPFGYKLTLI